VFDEGRRTRVMGRVLEVSNKNKVVCSHYSKKRDQFLSRGSREGVCLDVLGEVNRG